MRAPGCQAERTDSSTSNSERDGGLNIISVVQKRSMLRRVVLGSSSVGTLVRRCCVAYLLSAH